MAVARKGEFVAFCRLARGTRRFDMTAETWGDGGRTAAAMRSVYGGLGGVIV